MSKRFDWDSAKATANYRVHGVRFTEAISAFADPFALIAFDDEHSQSEGRELLIGRSSCKVLFVVFTERGQTTVRIISARKATREERTRYEQNKVIPI